MLSAVSVTVFFINGNFFGLLFFFASQRKIHFCVSSLRSKQNKWRTAPFPVRQREKIDRRVFFFCWNSLKQKNNQSTKRSQSLNCRRLVCLFCFFHFDAKNKKKTAEEETTERTNERNASRPTCMQMRRSAFVFGLVCITAVPSSSSSSSSIVSSLKMKWNWFLSIPIFFLF